MIWIEDAAQAALVTTWIRMKRAYELRRIETARDLGQSRHARAGQEPVLASGIELDRQGLIPAYTGSRQPAAMQCVSFHAAVQTVEEVAATARTGRKTVAAEPVKGCTGKMGVRNA